MASAGEFPGIVSGTAEHKFTVFQNQQARFYINGKGYLFFFNLGLKIKYL
jgi:hypothetical protein